jgi:hypothetical protein
MPLLIYAEQQQQQQQQQQTQQQQNTLSSFVNPLKRCQLEKMRILSFFHRSYYSTKCTYVFYKNNEGSNLNKALISPFTYAQLCIKSVFAASCT